YLRQENGALLRGVRAGVVLHHLREYARRQWIILGVEWQAALLELAPSVALGGLGRQQIPGEQSGREREQHAGIRHHLAMALDPLGEPGQRGGFCCCRLSCARHRRRHSPTSVTCFSPCPWGDSNTRPTV